METISLCYLSLPVCGTLLWHHVKYKQLYLYEIKCHLNNALNSVHVRQYLKDRGISELQIMPMKRGFPVDSQ